MSADTLEWQGLTATSEVGTYEVKREPSADEGDAWIFSVNGQESQIEFFTPENAKAAAEAHHFLATI